MNKALIDKPNQAELSHDFFRLALERLLKEERLVPGYTDKAITVRLPTGKEMESWQHTTEVTES